MHLPPRSSRVCASIQYTSPNPAPNHRHQALHYLRGWFLMDFVTSFPFDIVADFSSPSHSEDGQQQSGSMWNVFRILRFAKARGY